MFCSPRSLCRFFALSLAVGLIVHLSAIAGFAQQKSDDPAKSTRQHSASDKHVKEQIDEILKRAREGVERINKEVKDYECILIKQERVENKLQDMQFMQVKIRHEQRDGDKVTVPFSVYVKFLKPKKLAGREVLYVKGRDDGDVIARVGGTGRRAKLTVQIPPDDPRAMSGNRYPITQIGVVSLVEELIKVMENQIDPDNCVMKKFEDAKQDGRPCTHYELTVIKQQKSSTFMRADLYVDNEYRVPTYYQAYDWPDKEGGKPLLLEAYTYRNVKVNVGLTDKDFDPENPNYKFAKVEPLPPDAKTP